APAVQLASFDPSGAVYRVRFFTESYALEREAIDEVNDAIWYGLRRAGIDMPYPQTMLSFRERAADAEERRRREHLADAEDLLSRFDFLATLRAADRKLLAERARFLEYGPREAVVRQGEPAEAGASPAEEETNLLSRIGAMFGFGGRATG